MKKREKNTVTKKRVRASSSPNVRLFLSRKGRVFRENFKKMAAGAALFFFPKKSYIWFALPRGLTSLSVPVSTSSFSNPPPHTIENEIYWKFKEPLPLEEKGVFITSGIGTKLGGNLDSQGRLITDFLRPLDGKPCDKHDLFYFSTKRFFPKIYEETNPVVNLTTGWQGAFYHWMYEVLPRLHVVDKKAKIYINTDLPFQKESLALLGIAEERIIKAEVFDGVKTPQLIVPAIPAFPSLGVCDFLRKSFLPKLKRRERRRLYISRNDATRRRILNEEEVREVLTSFGFEKILLTPLSLKEQMELFYSAEMIVGPHGAGFSHLAFCAPQTPVLEIFSPAYVNTCYWSVSSSSSLFYSYFFGERERVDSKDPDILVDPKKLKRALDELLV